MPHLPAVKMPPEWKAIPARVHAASKSESPLPLRMATKP